MFVNSNQEKLYCYMSEEDAPYEKEEMPRPWTQEDEEFNKQLIEKYALTE